MRNRRAFSGLRFDSLIETIACQRIIHRRGWLNDTASLREAYRQASVLAARIQTLRKTIAPGQNWVREDIVDYTTALEDDPWSI